jgi:hypothetical protein
MAGQVLPEAFSLHAARPARAIHLTLGLLQVVLKCLAQLSRVGLLRHLRQRLQDLFLGVVHVLELVDEKGPPAISFWAWGIWPLLLMRSHARRSPHRPRFS